MDPVERQRMETELRSLKRERVNLRRAFTNIYNKLKTSLGNQNTPRDQLVVEFGLAEEKSQRLTAVENQVSEVLYKLTEDEAELAAEFDLTEDYRDKWTELVHLYKSKTNIRQGDVASVQTNNSTNSQLKLPKIELFKFDGEIKHWIKFWARFRKIHEDPNLDEEDKFQYLILSTKENTPARELIDSFPPSAKNYEKAVKQLKARFGRDSLLIQFYIRELLKLVLDQAMNTTRMPLRSLYDKLETPRSSHWFKIKKKYIPQVSDLYDNFNSTRKVI